MMNSGRAALLTVALIAVLSASCGSEESADTPAAQPVDEIAQLPPDHPPLDASEETGGVVPPPAGSGSGATGLIWSAPDSWIEETPSSSMRKAQYRIPGASGDAELVVFYFGPGQGGDAESNAARWVNEFTQSDGQPSSEAAKIEGMQIAEVAVTRVEVTGAYSGGGSMARGGEPKPGYMLLGAIAQGPDANWFFKLTGPEETVAGERAAFASLVESLQAGG